MSAAGKEVGMADCKQTAVCMPERKRFLTATEVAEILGISRSAALSHHPQVECGVGNGRKNYSGGQSVRQILL